MNDILQKLSKTLREAIEPLIKIQKNADPSGDKGTLSRIVADLFAAQDLTSSLQARCQVIVEEKNDLAKKLKEREHWSESAKGYESYRLHSGCTIKIVEEVNQNPYAAEWYCKHCFDKEIKSQLQPEFKSTCQSCPECGKDIWLDETDQRRYNEAFGLPPPAPEDVSFTL